MSRLNAHEALVASLLAEADRASSTTPHLTPPVPPAPPPPAPSPPVPAPSASPPRNLLPPLYPEATAPPPPPREEDVPRTLSQGPKATLRSQGYYVGVGAGMVSPVAGGIRWETSPGATPRRFHELPLSFSNGYQTGILLGRDFGNLRVETSADVLVYDESGGSGAARVYPFLARVIWDKPLNDRLDLRAGLASGATLAKIDYDGKSFGGAAFAYDFLLGAGVRLTEGIALNLDYRYFLTAASDGFRRLQAHLFGAQLQFDL